MDRLVTVKGNRYGMEIYMDSEVSFDILMKSMEEKFRNSAKFFQGAQMAVRFLGRRLTYLEEQAVLDLISNTTGIDVVCIIDGDPANETAYKSVVERTLSNVRKRDGQFYKGTLGKKQVVESDTSIVILGGRRIRSQGHFQRKRRDPWRSARLCTCRCRRRPRGVHRSAFHAAQTAADRGCRGEKTTHLSGKSSDQRGESRDTGRQSDLFGSTCGLVE